MPNEESYEEACARRREENDGYIREFDEWLMAAGLTDKTIKRHIDNVDFFLDAYLSQSCGYAMEDGCRCMDDFLGYFFIRKCMWSTPTSIRQNATSFKKFYKCMLEKGHVSQESYDHLLADIKEGLPLWVQDCEEYNNPDAAMLDDLVGSGGAGLFNAAYEAVARSLGLDGLLGLESEDDALDEEGLPSRQEVVRELTLALFYLTSWEERSPLGDDIRLRCAWKSADWDALDWLREQGYVNCTNKAKSVYLTNEGTMRAEETLTLMGLGHLVEPDESPTEGGTGKGFTLVK